MLESFLLKNSIAPPPAAIANGCLVRFAVIPPSPASIRQDSQKICSIHAALLFLVTRVLGMVPPFRWMTSMNRGGPEYSVYPRYQTTMATPKGFHPPFQLSPLRRCAYNSFYYYFYVCSPPPPLVRVRDGSSYLSMLLRQHANGFGTFLT